MSKRIVFPQQYGERKKAKLDITFSDHNFPLSQNVGSSKEPESNTWGDDNDDEILLLASQACEQAYNNQDTSILPDYSICMQPSTTSTQIKNHPRPGTSKNAFTFKKPITSPHNTFTTDTKEKWDRISSPLPGMSTKVTAPINQQVNLTDDLIISDKICKDQDTNYIYRQLLQLQEENAKLKSENGKLLEKCVTKEGEATILRTQLKSCQTAVDNARIEKIQAQEKVQMEWTDKLNVANNQLHDLKTQLDFKNLEIISMKEKCKVLESSKVKLTQITLANNDISSSHKNNHSTSASHEHIPPQMKRVKMASSSVQTKNKSPFLKLNKMYNLKSSQLINILPLILEPTVDQKHALLDYNEKLHRNIDFTENKCRIFSTFHRIPSTPVSGEKRKKLKISLSSIHEDVTCIAAGNCTAEDVQRKYINILNVTRKILYEVQCELETILQRVTTAFQKEMDEKYIEATSTFLIVDKNDLLRGSELFKEEQAVLARRMVAILTHVLEDSTSRCMDMFNTTQQCGDGNTTGQPKLCFIDIICKICNLVDSTSCATLYSGLLFSITLLIELLSKLELTPSDQMKVLTAVKAIISSRPMAFVSCQLLNLVRRLALLDNFTSTFCPGNNTGNLKVDYDQGVLLYKHDSCHLQILLKQIEVSLKCMEKPQLVHTTARLLALYNNSDSANLTQCKTRCDCQHVSIEVIVYALRICAGTLKNENCTQFSGHYNDQDLENITLAVCRSGVHTLYRCCIRDTEGGQLVCDEGQLLQFCELMRTREHAEVYSTMLSELAGPFQSPVEETPSSYNTEAWLKSFQTFTMAD